MTDKPTKSWLTFTIDEGRRGNGARTRVWAVQNVEKKAHLGVVAWHGAFRKYCFFPVAETIFDAVCLTDIA